jgi:anti-anti-sigma factor
MISRLTEPARTTTYRIDVDLSEPRVVLTGEFDVSAVADLTAALRRIDPFGARLRLDLSGVTFFDSSALEPLVAASRRRAAEGQSPIAIEATSSAVDRILDLLQVDGRPLLDVDAWDRIRVPAPGHVVDHRAERSA